MAELQPISLGIVVRHNIEALLVKRAHTEQLADGSELTWAFPGGKVEPNESSSQAAEREVLEETGYHVAAHTLITEGAHLFSPVFVSYWACELQSDERDIVQDPRIHDIAWVPIFGLHRYITSPLNHHVVSYLYQL